MCSLSDVERCSSMGVVSPLTSSGFVVSGNAITSCVAACNACENRHLSSFLAAENVSSGETSVPHRQKFRTDDLKSVYGSTQRS